MINNLIRQSSGVILFLSESEQKRVSLPIDCRGKKVIYFFLINYFIEIYQRKEVNILMKKILALLLTVLLVLAVMLPLTASAYAADTDLRTYPTVYIKGKVGALVNEKGTPDEYVVYDGDRVPVPDGYIEDVAKELVPMFLKSVVTDDYTEWAQKMSRVLEPIYKDFVLDQNGKARPRSGQQRLSYDIEHVPNVVKNGMYDLHGYAFDYDWRLSPLDVAEELRAYILKIKEVTGKAKVNLVARCEGCCVSMAYLYKYGCYDVASCILLSPSSNGSSLASSLFAGDFHLQGGAVNRYLEHGEQMEKLNTLIKDDLIRRLLVDTVKLMAVTPGVDLTDAAIQGILDKILPMIMPGLIMSSYGTLPSHWAMVDDARYEAAKQMTGIADDPAYANFVALIDEYHYNVQNRHGEILRSCMEKGMGVAILVKYGDEMFPIMTDSEYPNDNTVTVAQASLGATMAKIGEKLDAEGEYVSPDGLIDASTCPLPDNTWFFKYMDHNEWDRGVNEWTLAFLRSGGKMTVRTDPAWPQFLVFDDKTGACAPMTEENAFRPEEEADDAVAPAASRFLDTIKALLDRIIAFFKGVIEGIIGHAKGTVPPVE